MCDYLRHFFMLIICNMNTIVALRTHIMNSEILKLYEQLCQDLGEERVYILYNNTRHPLGSLLPPAAKVMIFNEDECFAINSMHKSGYGHNEVSWSFWHPETSAVMFHDFIKDKSFDAIWFIEYDVRCHGNFAIPLAECDKIKADFMAKGGDDRNTFRLQSKDSWCWWAEGLTGEIVHEASIDKRVGAFFPMVRLSKKMIEALRERFGKSTGFCEVYCSTVCVVAGLVAVPMPESVFEIFRYRPDIKDYNTTPPTPPTNRLYHPVKCAV